jgi:hypothetical protein
MLLQSLPTRQLAAHTENAWGAQSYILAEPKLALWMSMSVV